MPLSKWKCQKSTYIYIRDILAKVPKSTQIKKSRPRPPQILFYQGFFEFEYLKS